MDATTNFCRVCFAKDDEDYICIVGNICQIELLSVGNIEVFEEDGLSNLLCKKCKIILSNAYKFKQICKRSDTLLKTFPMTGVVPPKLNIPQEALPSNEPVKPPEPKVMVSVGTETDEEVKKELNSIGIGCEPLSVKSIGTECEAVSRRTIGTGCEPLKTKSIKVGCSIDIKESSTQTDVHSNDILTVDQMEMIIENEDEQFESVPIIAPPTLFEDEVIAKKETTIMPIDDGKPKILSNIKILNNKYSDVATQPAKQFKKKSNIKQEKPLDIKPTTILNSKLKIPQSGHQIIETIEETPDGSIEIIAYEEEYLDEEVDKKEIEEKVMDKSEDGVVYTCDVCEKGFPLLQQLEIHKENHTRARDHPCYHCDKAFFSKYDLAKHILTHTKQKDYTCVVCNKSFSRSTLLHRHEKIHTDPNIPRYNCPDCSRVYLNKLDYEKHQMVHAKSRPFACNHCDKKFAFKQGLERHEVIHDMQSMPHSCQYCSDRFKSASRLQRHLSAAHAGTRAFPCSKCNKRFMLSHHLYRHMRTSHKNENEDITLQCPECEENFIQREVFFDHCLDHATVSLICPMCKYESESLEDINSHVLLHSKMDMYFCDYCSCIFMSQDVLNEHFVDKHSDELCGIVENDMEFIVEKSSSKQSGKRKDDKTFKLPEVPAKKQKTHELEYIDNSMSGASFVEYDEDIMEPFKVEKEPEKSVREIRKVAEQPKPKPSTGTTIQRVKMSLSEIKRLQKEGKIVMQDGMLVMKQ